MPPGCQCINSPYLLYISGRVPLFEDVGMLNDAPGELFRLLPDRQKVWPLTYDIASENVRQSLVKRT